MLSAIITLIVGLLKFPRELADFIQLLRGTPEEQRARLLSQIKSASQKADETEGNMDGYDL